MSSHPTDYDYEKNIEEQMLEVVRLITHSVYHQSCVYNQCFTQSPTVIAALSDKLNQSLDQGIPDRNDARPSPAEDPTDMAALISENSRAIERAGRSIRDKVKK